MFGGGEGQKVGQGSDQEGPCGDQSKKQGFIPRVPWTHTAGQERGTRCFPEPSPAEELLLLYATALPGICPITPPITCTPQLRIQHSVAPNLEVVLNPTVNNLSASPLGSTFKIYLESEHFSADPTTLVQFTIFSCLDRDRYGHLHTLTSCSMGSTCSQVTVLNQSQIMSILWFFIPLGIKSRVLLTPTGPTPDHHFLFCNSGTQKALNNRKTGTMQLLAKPGLNQHKAIYSFIYHP